MRQFAFTLAETMIVLTVIAIIAGIILPVAFKAKPDEDLARFKKYDAVIETAIKTLATSDEYFMSGNMTLTPDGANPRTSCYFTNAFANILTNVEEIYCPTLNETLPECESEKTKCAYTNSSDFQTFIEKLDVNEAGEIGRTGSVALRNIFRKEAPTGSGTIKLNHEALIVIETPQQGICKTSEGKRYYTHGDEGKPYCSDENNFDTNYGYITLIIGKDIDFVKLNDGLLVNEINAIYNFEYNQKVNSFVYAFTADGKIVAGNKVEEWRAKEL